MKSKIIITLICAFAAWSVTAQDNPLVGGGKPKQLTVAEANALNGSKEPTVNGKPYSQHKAEQEALKKERAIKAQQAANNTNRQLPTVSAVATIEPAKPAQEPASTPYPGYNAPEKKPVVTQQAIVGTGTPTRNVVNLPVGEGLSLSTAEAATSQDAAITQQQKLVLPEATKTAQHEALNKPQEPYKTKEIPAGNAPKGKETIDPQPAKVEAAVVSNKEVKTNPAPVVPDQFKLPAAQNWNGRAVSTEASVVKSDPAQSIDAVVATGQYKAPTMDKSNKSTGDEGKKPATKPAPVVDAKLVDAGAKKDPASVLGQLPAMGIGEATTVKQQDKPIAGTSLDPKVALGTEKIVQTKATDAAAPAPEKGAGRTAAELDALKAREKEAEMQKNKQPAPEKKGNATPPPGMVTGVGNGEVAKATDTRTPQVEAPAATPKKD